MEREELKLRNVLRIIMICGVLFPWIGVIYGFLGFETTVLIAFFSCILLLTEYYLFERNFLPQESKFHLNLEEVRKLGNSERDQLPLRVNSLIVAEGEIPDWIVVAGGALNNFPISFTSFQVVYDDKTGIIESPFNRKLFDQFCRFKLLGIKGKWFHEERYNILQQSMLDASFIVATHEHWDHVGGIAQSPYLKEIIKKTVLTTEQITSHTINRAGFPLEIFDNYISLDYDQYHVLAPGVVLIKTPGHSIGSQTIYLKLQNGEEFLFIGDIAWNMINIEKLKNHSRIGMLIRYENGRKLGHQLRWLFDNIHNNSNEKLNLVPSHDLEKLKDYRRVGIIGNKFEKDQSC